MSDHEKRTTGGVGVDTGALVESATSRHKQPIRPIDMQEESHKELQHKRSKAPAVPSATEDLKNDSVKNEIKESEQAISPEKQKHNVAKKLSSASKRRESSPESLKLAPPAIDVKKSSKSAVQPIPDHAPMTGIEPKKKQDDKLEEEDSITEELRAPEMARDTSEWSDDEEASGLPRSESRGSRVSRAVRQLFCCGMPLDTPSEHQISPRTQYDDIA